MKKYSLSQLAAIYATYKDLNPKTKTVRCCTCGKTIQINCFEDCYKIWGHYIARSLEPKLKYHPNNTFAQCSSCNVFSDSNEMQEKYDKYMSFRFGSDIKQKLSESEPQTEEYYKNFYTIELLKLSTTFPELKEIFIDETTGEVVDVTELPEENSIEKQFNTFSPTFKSDLDVLCRALNCEYVEYNRL